jgi:DNA-binding transcriptional regulator YhcF (GntR family)
VVQAYRELESEGLVATRQGAGTFVLDLPAERRTSDRIEEARRLVRDLVAEAGRMGISPADLRTAMDHEINGRND